MSGFETRFTKLHEFVSRFAEIDPGDYTADGIADLFIDLQAEAYELMQEINSDDDDEDGGRL